MFHPAISHVVSLFGLGTIYAVFTGALPVLASVGAILWYASSVYKTQMYNDFVAMIKRRFGRKPPVT